MKYFKLFVTSSMYSSRGVSVAVQTLNFGSIEDAEEAFKLLDTVKNLPGTGVVQRVQRLYELPSIIPASRKIRRRDKEETEDIPV